jgi:bacteriocin-like protein
MSIEEVIRAWKSGEQAVEPHLPPSPVGQVLSEEELSEEELFNINGGALQQCTFTCFWTFGNL